MTADPTPPETAPARRSTAAFAGLWIVLAICLVEFGLPGFIAGIYLRFFGTEFYIPPKNRVAAVLFYPALQLAKNHTGVYAFYEWEMGVIIPRKGTRKP